MRLILVDRLVPERRNFYPLALSRPIWELRCGMRSLGERLTALAPTVGVACFLPPYLADDYRRRTLWPVNDPRSLVGDDLLALDARVKASRLPFAAEGPGQVICGSDGEVLAARIPATDLPRLRTDSIESLLESARERLPAAAGVELPAWKYIWDLVVANSSALSADFQAAGQSGCEGTIEEPVAVRGSRHDLYVAPGAVVHPMVVLDAEHGPIYIDQQAEIHPFTRIEGPCYVGRGSILLGAKCRTGCSIGPMCRIGGEIEESIVHGSSNKYHDGFLGHAYVGQWVNLGALTTNSDLKNDYSPVSMVLDGRTPIDTGLTKIGARIGDHAKTSIGTLLNTGAYVGAMAMIVTSGELLPKFIPSFTWFIRGTVSSGMGKDRLLSTAKTVLARRRTQWTEIDQTLWNAIFDLTAAEREALHQ